MESVAIVAIVALAIVALAAMRMGIWRVRATFDKGKMSVEYEDKVPPDGGQAPPGVSHT